MTHSSQARPSAAPRSPHRGRRGERGFTLIESFIALAVVAVGMLGMLSLQTVGVRANFMSKSMATADALARDLSEHVAEWDFNDARLKTTVNLDSTSIGADAFLSSWDLGRGATTTNTSIATGTTTTVTMQYSEVSADPNATVGNALTTGTAPYTGIVADTTKFSRYWNVYNYNGGKLVQIVVRWKEPTLGYRQVAISTFKQAVYIFGNGS
jgi:prepilin-type N-terminal cleavage/methylation domain-containing protein